MATDTLISELDPCAPLTAADLLEIEQGVDPDNTSGKVTMQQISDFCSLTGFTVKTASGVISSVDGETIVMNVGTANTLTVQADADVNFPIGTIKNVLQEGTGQVTILAAAGVTIRCAAATAKARAQFSAITLIKRAANLWYLFGDLASS